MVSARKRRSVRGFTLMEVMVAVLVTTAALIGSLSLLGTIYRSGSFSRNATEAGILAQAKLEAELSRTPIAAGTTPNPPDGITQEAGLNAFGSLDTTSGLGIYTRNTTWATTADLQRRSITVTVGWNDSMARNHTVTVMTERAP